jgi:hypothetical protein
MARGDRREEIFGDERDRWKFLGYLAEGAERGEGFLRKLKDQWNQRAERPKNYGQKRNWSAFEAKLVLERVSEHFQSDLETLKKRGIRGNPARRCAISALLGSRWVESLRNCDVIPYAQQQFGGSDDSANQDLRRSNSEGPKASNKS